MSFYISPCPSATSSSVFEVISLLCPAVPSFRSLTGRALYLKSLRAAVEVVYGHRRQVNILKTANIDGGHRIAFWIDAFSVWKNAADGAETMLNNVLIEGVGASRIFGGKQAKIGSWHKPQKRSST
ncbi:NAD-specific glutamate dehydrogenase, large form [Candidatus Nitrotoga arctica]|uniref:NAD-specific glutamate dehydrogenase, large form n=1 Tax=Candidatus Nitrotoga arctica TaxID=453162 RepID=A0ABM8YYS5_9PROT|nr:NAD-specific glutamate dehydrogenase, large form [Candidatus Nitrotoga arctica]